MTLIVDRLGKRYGDTAVFSGVSLRVEPGEFVAIVGESGVGKSSLLNCLAALDDWSEGTIHHDGVDLGTLGETQRAHWRREHLGFVFQAFHVLPHLDVAQNVGLPLLLLGRPDTARVQAMLDAVGLGELGSRLPAELSGGQLQRVAIVQDRCSGCSATSFLNRCVPSLNERHRALRLLHLLHLRRQRAHPYYELLLGCLQGLRLCAIALETHWGRMACWRARR